MRRAWVCGVVVSLTGALLGLAVPARGAGSVPPAGPRAEPPPRAVALAAAPDGRGYWLADARGAVVGFGSAAFRGSSAGSVLPAPVVALAGAGDDWGYWTAGADGTVSAFGDVDWYGSGSTAGPGGPVVGMAATPDHRGYWLLRAGWGVEPFGDATGLGPPSAGLPVAGGAGTPATPAVGMAVTGDGHGYWVAGSDGTVLAFGDAVLSIPAARARLGAPVVGMAATPDGRGFWLAARDGEVAAFGDALGSGGARGLSAPVVGVADNPAGGYWLVGADGGVFAFGGAPYLGGVPVPPGQARMAVFGDSLATQARSYLTFVAGRVGVQVVGLTYGGTAVCDALGAIAADAEFLRPRAAVLEFSGNAMTPCMQGYPAGSPAFFAKYRRDTEAAIGLLQAAGARVFLAGAPPTATAAGSANLERLDAMYAGLADGRPGIGYVDAGRAVTVDGRFVWRMRCLALEPCLNADGTNTVRAPDGVHFCPGAWEPDGTCVGYASGAFRFGMALLAPVARYIGR